MDEAELKLRTKRFALQIIRLVNGLPNTLAAPTIGNQLLRAGMSVGANYRAACQGKSKPDFIAKTAIALEEADECLYWLELLQEAHIASPESLNPSLKEADELTAIFHASVKTARKPSNS